MSETPKVPFRPTTFAQVKSLGRWMLREGFISYDPSTGRLEASPHAVVAALNRRARQEEAEARASVRPQVRPSLADAPDPEDDGQDPAPLFRDEGERPLPDESPPYTSAEWDDGRDPN